ncbi:MAG: alginate O-acetyltransferase AlgX-related protein [Bacteroidia bacterium]
MRLTKHILFALFLLILLSEQVLFFKLPSSIGALKGAFVPVEKPVLSFDNWYSGQYQEQFMKYHEQNMFVHPLLIRLRNQISYSFFNELNSKDIEEGKNHVLFESAYIDQYMGKYFLGDDSIAKKIKKLAFVQAELKKRNIDLIFVIAPGKPSILPEYLPARYDLSQKTKSDYDAYAEQLQKQKINYIDITSYFKKIKHNSKHALFTKCGTHWSGYGATLAADTTFKYLEKLRNIDLPDYYDAGGEESFIPRGTDADLGNVLNLMVDIPSDKMYYPKIIFKKDPSKTKPNLLIIGDSFVWSWIGFYEFLPNLFNEKTSFWYYNHDVGWGANPENKLVKDLDLKNEALNRDVIIIVNNEVSLYNSGQHFIENMFKMLKKETENANK